MNLLLQHFPDPSEHLLRYYGWVSNVGRGGTGKRVNEERFWINETGTHSTNAQKPGSTIAK